MIPTQQTDREAMIEALDQAAKEIENIPMAEYNRQLVDRLLSLGFIRPTGEGHDGGGILLSGRHYRGAMVDLKEALTLDEKAHFEKCIRSALARLEDALRNAPKAPQPIPLSGVVDHGICQGCGQKLEPKEIEHYGTGWCHVIPVCCGHAGSGDCCGSPDPSPCGPVHRFIDADLERLTVATDGWSDVITCLRDLVDENDCWLDHHGGCQEHGYLSLEDGEECPHATAKRLIKKYGHE